MQHYAKMRKISTLLLLKNILDRYKELHQKDFMIFGLLKIYLGFNLLLICCEARGTMIAYIKAIVCLLLLFIYYWSGI